MLFRSLGVSGDRGDLAKRREIGSDDDGDRVPPTGVVSVDSRDFGTRTRGNRTATPVIATAVLSKLPAGEQGPDLPEYAQVNRRISREIITDKPTGDDAFKRTKVGAADRSPSTPLDDELRPTRIFGGRQPAKINNDNGGLTPPESAPRDTRKVGAVDRPPPVKNNDDFDKGIKDGRYQPPESETKRKADPPSKQPPGSYSPPREAKDPPRETSPTKRSPGYDSPPREMREPSEGEPVKRPQRDEPPRREEKPRSETPPARQPPRSDSPPREAKPPSESPKPQPKSEPKSEGPIRPSKVSGHNPIES